MMHSTLSSTCAALAALVLLGQGASSLPWKRETSLRVRQQQALGSPLFLDAPACDSYQCTVIYHPGDNATAHWTDAPDGNVVLDFMTNASSVLAHHVATVPGVTSNCDSEGQTTCGQFSWIVPSDWVGGNYTLRATSEAQPDVESYTDVILVQAGTDGSASVPFMALDPVAGSNSSTSTATSANTTASSTASQGSATPAQSTSNSTSQSSTDAARQTNVHTPLILLACTFALATAYL